MFAQTHVCIVCQCISHRITSMCAHASSHVDFCVCMCAYKSACACVYESVRAWMDGCACACMRACACMHAFVHARAHAIVYACESIYAHKRYQCVYLCAYMHQPIHVISIHLEYVGLHYKPHAMRTYQRGFNAGRKNEKR